MSTDYNFYTINTFRKSWNWIHK